MICKKCGSKMRVTDVANNGVKTFRRLRCSNCNHHANSVEEELLFPTVDFVSAFEIKKLRSKLK